jgi:hypothetical protein
VYRAGQIVGVGAVHGSGPGGAAGQDVGGTGQPGQYHRAEQLPFEHIDRHLDAAGDHRLDDDAGQAVAEGILQRAEPAPDLIRAAQVKQDGRRHLASAPPGPARRP